LKPQTRVMDVSSTLEGERIELTIDKDALAHIMSVLTDLYSDPELAVIREYSTNAYDAHVEAGVTRPIEITTPTALAPFFRVRDYGKGLDIEDIREIYSKYGASTKRDSNDLIGSLGLGCKSALTYTDQFTLTGIKDGICTQVSISRDENGGGSMIVVDQYATNDESGVEIIVPAMRYNSFEDKSNDFFRFWNEGTVLVNGETPKRIDGVWITDDLLLVQNLDYDQIVMGNVAYPLESSGMGSYRRWDNRYSVVAFVEIGAVHFPPSREGLLMNAQTKKTIEDISNRVSEHKQGSLEKMINDAPNRVEAIQIAEKAKAMGLNGDPTYKGETIPQSFEYKQNAQLPIVVAHDKYRYDKGWQRGRQLLYKMFENSHFLVGYEGADFTPTKRKKLHQWVDKDHQNRYAKNYILVNKVPGDIHKWIDPKTVFPWSEIAAEKIIREKNATLRNGRVSGSYDAYVDGDWRDNMLAEDIDTSKPLYFIGDKWAASSEKRVLDAAHKNGYTLAIMSRNRLKKFQRDFPAAKEAHKALPELAKKWADRLTEEERLAYVVQRHRYFNIFRALDHEKVDDPDLIAGIKASSLKSAQLGKAQIFEDYVDVPKPKWNSPLGKYAILTSLSTYGTLNKEFVEHLHIYVNAAYAAEQENN